jgi:hypothetical protein
MGKRIGRTFGKGQQSFNGLLREKRVTRGDNDKIDNGDANLLSSEESDVLVVSERSGRVEDGGARIRRLAVARGNVVQMQMSKGTFERLGHVLGGVDNSIGESAVFEVEEK